MTSHFDLSTALVVLVLGAAYIEARRWLMRLDAAIKDANARADAAARATKDAAAAVADIEARLTRIENRTR